MRRNGEATARAEPDRTPPQPPVSGDRYRLLALAGITVALVGLCALVAAPFLPALTWGVALAIMAWPLHAWVSRLIMRPSLAAAVSTTAVVLLIIVPGLLVTYQIAREAAAAAEQAQQQTGEGDLRARVATIPGLSDVAAWAERANLNLEGEIRKWISSYAQDTAGLAQGSIAAIIQFLVAVFILYYLFRDQPAFLSGLRSQVPLSRAESDRVFQRAADSVHANLYATIVTSLIDSIGGGLMFWLLGLASPVLWGSVIFVLSILPVVGAALVWLPAAVFLAMEGHWPQAGALVAWGLASWMVVDNVIYVRLAGHRMRMHAVPAMIAFLGGLAVFGISGMILGPAIVAVTEAVLEAWKRRVGGANDLVVGPAGQPLLELAAAQPGVS